MTTQCFTFQRVKKVVFCIVLAVSQSFGLSSYYVSSAGSDANDGKSTTAPWKTISKVNSVTFAPGDAIFFQGGDSFFGQIDVNQSGVTIGAYNDGVQKPVITGATQLSGWAVYSGSIYVAQASSLVKNLFANSVQMTLARYPNTGFLTIGTTNGSTTITATGLNQASGYWNGANVRMRTRDWTFETRTVSSYNGTTITIIKPPDYHLTIGYGFYLDNKLAALDAPGEWYCDPGTNKVYFYAPGGVDPNTLIVAGSVFDYGINSSQSNITVQGLEFRYQVQAALMFSGTTMNTLIISNNIYGALIFGISVNGTSTKYTIDGNTIRLVNGVGLYLQNANSTIIKNNTIKNIGLVQGYGRSGTGGMMGIAADGSGNTIRSNIVDSVGYVGIEVGGSNTLVENNVVTNVMLKLNDGGAIYTYMQHSNDIRHNIVNNVTGNTDGEPAGLWIQGNGIYLDGVSNNYGSIVEDNTIINVATDGITLQIGSYGHTLRNNTIYKCASTAGGKSIFIGIDATLGQWGSHVIKGNILYPSAGIPTLIRMDEEKGTTVHSPGTLDSNYYCNPYNNATQFLSFRLSNKAYSWYSFAQWKTATGQDAHSKYIPASYQRDTVFINSTAYPVMVNLPSVLFHDLDNNSFAGSFILAPFSSKILIRDTARVNSTITREK